LGADAGVAEPVVASALVRVAQDRVGFGGLLEALLGLVVTGVLVGVVLDRELAIGGLQLAIGRRPRDPENLVIVSLTAHSKRSNVVVRTRNSTGAARKMTSAERASRRPALGCGRSVEKVRST